jgi:hypothetical protein
MHEKIKSSVSYNPETGVFIRLKSGSIAGYKDRHGYIYLKIGNTRYAAHRLAWFFIFNEFPLFPIDHIDGDPANNCIRNLRNGSNGINQQNSKKYKGVSIDRGKFRAQISLNGKTINLGRFRTYEEARAIYIKAKRDIHNGCSHF